MLPRSALLPNALRSLAMPGLVALAVSVCAPARAADCAPGQVDLRGDFGSVRFEIEIADTPETRARGLMNRSELGRFAGMLFVQDSVHEARFWMKNTLIPLDMIFVDDTGVVVSVHSRAVPGDLTPISSGAPVRAVLEVNGGTAERLGIGPGTELRHPAFAAAGAAWPCPAS